MSNTIENKLIELISLHDDFFKPQTIFDTLILPFIKQFDLSTNKIMIDILLKTLSNKNLKKAIDNNNRYEKDSDFINTFTLLVFIKCKLYELKDSTFKVYKTITDYTSFIKNSKYNTCNIQLTNMYIS